MKDIKKALKNGEVIFGTIIGSGNPDNIEISGYVGYDFVFIDLEHGTPSPLGKEAKDLIRAAYAADITPLVRVVNNDAGQIKKVLDAGAKGIIAPFISTQEEAKKLVDACLYPPEGNRGASPGVRAAKFGAMSWFEYVKKSNEELIIAPIVERMQGIRNIEKICSVQGINLIFCGFLDLAMELGIKPKGESAFSELEEVLTDTAIEGYTDTLIRTATEKGVYVANTVTSAESALDLVRRGCRVITSPPDTCMFVGIAKKFLEDAKSKIAKTS